MTIPDKAVEAALDAFHGISHKWTSEDMRCMADALAAAEQAMWEPNEWRETVRYIYDELHFGLDSIFEGEAKGLARRLVDGIDKRHHDFFCEATPLPPPPETKK